MAENYRAALNPVSRCGEAVLRPRERRTCWGCALLLMHVFGTGPPVMGQASHTAHHSTELSSCTHQAWHFLQMPKIQKKPHGNTQASCSNSSEQPHVPLDKDLPLWHPYHQPLQTPEHQHLPVTVGGRVEDEAFNCNPSFSLSV